MHPFNQPHQQYIHTLFVDKFNTLLNLMPQLCINLRASSLVTLLSIKGPTFLSLLSQSIKIISLVAFMNCPMAKQNESGLIVLDKRLVSITVSISPAEMASPVRISASSLGCKFLRLFKCDNFPKES